MAKSGCRSAVYTVAVGESPVIPEYDYAEVAGKIAELDYKVTIIKQVSCKIK